MTDPRPTPPGYGMPCNGCGVCCERTVCPIGRALMDDPPAPCPALEFREGKSVCGLIVDPERYVARAHMRRTNPTEVAWVVGTMNGAGIGCDMRDFAVPDELRIEARLRAHANRHRKHMLVRLQRMGLMPFFRRVYGTE